MSAVGQDLIGQGQGQEQEQGTGSAPFPLNRVVAFLGPYVAIASGAGAAWLSQHFPGVHVNKTTLASTISEAIVFVIGTGVTFAMHHKWLTGWQQWEKAITDVVPLASSELMPSGSYDPAEFAAALPPATEFEGAMAQLPAGPADGAAQISRPSNGASAHAPAGNHGQAQLPSAVLPTAEEEFVSVPSATPGLTGAVEAVAARPETAAIPDPPADEFEPAVM